MSLNLKRFGLKSSQMKTGIAELAKTVLSARRKVFFQQKPIFEAYQSLAPGELDALARKIGAPIPDDLQVWLLATGYGDVGGELSFRGDWIAPIEKGQLKGGVIFAQDILGNFYAFDVHGCIYYLSRSQPAFARMSEDFIEFIEALIDRDYRVIDWTETLVTQSYDW